jgi:hypothetical protein
MIRSNGLSLIYNFPFTPPVLFMIKHGKPALIGVVKAMIHLIRLAANFWRALGLVKLSDRSHAVFILLHACLASK